MIVRSLGRGLLLRRADPLPKLVDRRRRMDSNERADADRTWTACGRDHRRM